MKISLLTFSRESNFGAALQCYALGKSLREMGHDVRIMDIQLHKKVRHWHTALLQFPQDFLFSLFRKKHFAAFTKKYGSVSALMDGEHNSDLYIVGSDQVWNPDITRCFDPLVYFFSFLPKGKRRISYAASFGTESWHAMELTERVQVLLREFQAVSVREQSGVAICKDTFGIDAQLVFDPTFLLPAYDELCGPYDPSRETDELVYFTFIRKKEEQEIIADFAEANGLKATVLRSNRSIPRFKHRRYLSVPDWLNAIRYARIVVTNSFHCMVFCILFHKKFVAVPAKEGRTTRQVSLLEHLGLSACYCEDSTRLYSVLEQQFGAQPDYDEIDRKIQEARAQSLAFLKDAGV